jgi:hypothetical protein
MEPAMARSLEQPKAPRPQDRGPDYDDDFFRWTQHQAGLLRAGRFDLADVDNLALEIEDMGKRDRRALGSRLEVLIVHLLKWQFQPEMRAGSWRGTIRTQRGKVLSILADSPGLRPEVSSIADQRYERAAATAADQTGLAAAALPDACPYSTDQLLDEEFFP